MSITNLFFRPFDKARLDRLVEAIYRERLSAALISDSEGLLDHYGRMLVKKLRETKKLSVEVYYPNSTDALLNRFNKILEDIPIDSAIVSNEDSNVPGRVLVAFDSQATGLREVQLMARLVKDFPGANTRVILMLDKRSSTQYDKKIEAFGNNIIRWDIATPTQHEASVLLSEAELTGMQPEVRQALTSVGVSLDAKLALAASNRAINRAEETLGNLEKDTQIKSSQVETARGEKDKIDRNISATKQNISETSSLTTQKKKLEDSLTDSSENANDGTQKATSTRNSDKINALLAATCLLFISAGVIFLADKTNSLSLEKILDEGRNIFLQNARVENLLENNKNTTIALPNSQSSDDSDENKESFTKDNSVSDSEDSFSSTSTALLNKQIIATNNEADSQEAEQSITPLRPSKENSSETVNRKVITELIATIDPGFYVQHTARPNLQLVTKIKSDYKGLSESKIFKLRKTKSDGFFYVVLSGPFDTLEEAKIFSQRSDIPSGTWIGGALSIRPLLVPLN